MELNGGNVCFAASAAAAGRAAESDVTDYGAYIYIAFMLINIAIWVCLHSAWRSKQTEFLWRYPLLRGNVTKHPHFRA